MRRISISSILGRILGAFICWAGSGLCAYAIYWIISLIINGAITNSWLMVIAGGILAYLFIFLLGIGVIFLFIIGLMVLFK